MSTKQALIAEMDRQASALDLPSHTELLSALQVAHEALFNETGEGGLHMKAVLCIDIALRRAGIEMV